MIIEISNNSSPGASFTKNTNNVILKTYEWICENKGMSLPFSDFRMKLQSDKGINDNNNRNIFPLLKNGELVSYEPNNDIFVNDFFTKEGLAYAKVLELSKKIKEADYSEEQKKEAQDKIINIKQEIIYDSLVRIVRKPEVNYAEPIKDFVKFVLKYEKISKVEYAYLIYEQKTKNIEESLKDMEQNIQRYREGLLEFEVDVEVRNDIEIREKTKSKKRKEGLSFLTSYAYFVGLLQQAGLLEKQGNYYCIVEERRNRMELLGGNNNE